MKIYIISIVVLVVLMLTGVFLYPELIEKAIEPSETQININETDGPIAADTSLDVLDSETDRKPIIRYPIPEITSDVLSAETIATTESSGAKLKPQEKPIKILPLPVLEKSDGLIFNIFNRLFDASSVKMMFRNTNFIPRVVVTVDNLLNKSISPEQFPTTSVRGKFKVSGREGSQILSQLNYKRYRLYIKMLESVNQQELVRAYIKMYPLFQQAYLDLGKQDVYFNDRLVDVIDDLLISPEINKPIKLSRKSVMFKFADSQLESLSTGQKIMIRMGPENAKRVKKVLASIRKMLLK